jgi:hypothetical protein
LRPSHCAPRTPDTADASASVFALLPWLLP